VVPLFVSSEADFWLAWEDIVLLFTPHGNYTSDELDYLGTVLR